MSILHRSRPPVQPAPAVAAASWPSWTDDIRFGVPETFTPFDDTGSDEGPHDDAPPEDASDLAWVLEQACYHSVRTEREEGGWGVHGIAACCLHALVKSMRFHRLDSAEGYARVTGTATDDEAVRTLLPRRSPLARALDVEASWYAHQDTAAARLAARAVLDAADLAETFGSADADAFIDDEAAHRAALADAADMA